MNDKLSHIDTSGDPRMVDISQKPTTSREAWARSIVDVGEDILKELVENDIHTKKGPVFQTAIIAGVMGAKKTSELIPFCHQLPLDKCDIKIKIENNLIVIDCITSVNAKTGVEMEAIVGASTAAITIYDMCKAMSHDIKIVETKLIQKTGGKSEFKSNA